MKKNGYDRAGGIFSGVTSYIVWFRGFSALKRTRYESPVVT